MSWVEIFIILIAMLVVPTKDIPTHILGPDYGVDA